MRFVSIKIFNSTSLNLSTIHYFLESVNQFSVCLFKLILKYGFEVNVNYQFSLKTFVSNAMSF